MIKTTEKLFLNNAFPMLNRSCNGRDIFDRRTPVLHLRYHLCHHTMHNAFLYQMFIPNRVLKPRTDVQIDPKSCVAKIHLQITAQNIWNRFEDQSCIIPD